MREMVDLLDTSNYAEDHPLFSNKNKKTPGKFKDELGGKYYVSNNVFMVEILLQFHHIYHK